MPLGRPRRRRRSGRPVLVFFLVVVLLGGAAAGLWYAHLFLSRDLYARITALETQITDLDAALDQAARTRDSLAVDLEDAQARLRFTQARYERDVPSGEVRHLLDLVRDALEDGADPGRLALMIEAGSRPMRCNPDSGPRLLAVAHPGARRQAGSLEIDGADLSITAEGRTAEDNLGRPEDWFDPERPVRVLFSTPNAEEAAVVNGILPLEHTLVSGSAEYRVSIEAGRRGFVEVTVVRCAFP